PMEQLERLSRSRGYSEATRIIVFDPGECHSCDTKLVEQRSVSGHGPVVVVATRAPTPSETILLRRYRVTIASVLRNARISDTGTFLINAGNVARALVSDSDSSDS